MRPTIYLQADPYAGIVFNGADYSALARRARQSAPDTRTANDMEMFEYRAPCLLHSYVQAGRQAAPPNCNRRPPMTNGHPIPTLTRQELVGNAMTEVPLVEGIELIDYRFWASTLLATGFADNYTTKHRSPR